MSSVYCPTPVRKRKSSLRSTDRPMRGARAAFMTCASGAHGLGRHDDGLHDVLVTRAAAQVALQAGADLLVGGMRMVLDEIDRAHDHAGGAKAALQPVTRLEGSLHGMKRAIAGCD